jgi:hypothetical protein
VPQAAGALTNIAQALRSPPLSDGALARVAERVQQAQREDFSVRRAVARISRGAAEMPPEARQRRQQRAKQRLAAALEGSPGKSARRPESASSSRSSNSYVSACTTLSASTGTSDASFKK